MFDLKTYLQERAARIDRELEAVLPAPTREPQRLHEAMRYSVLSGGKRVRPVLCLAAAEAVGGNAGTAVPPALGLELLHAYTLVHDDLPCMDDDAMRRGKPTVHVAFGEAMAVLTGDALQALAFETVAGAKPPDPYSAADVVRELAFAAGSLGVVGGQVDDMGLDTGTLTAERLESVHLRKTARLFRAAARMGAMAGGADAQGLAALTQYGEAIGLAFQIADDLLDAGEERTGDQEASCLAVYTPDEARQKAAHVVGQATAALSGLPADATRPLQTLAAFVIERKK